MIWIKGGKNRQRPIFCGTGGRKRMYAHSEFAFPVSGAGEYGSLFSVAEGAKRPENDVFYPKPTNREEDPVLLLSSPYANAR